jgi:hypothetical protein
MFIITCWVVPFYLDYVKYMEMLMLMYDDDSYLKCCELMLMYDVDVYGKVVS